MSDTQKGTGPVEFVIMLAMLMSMMALAIDTVLPALPDMGTELGVIDATENQLIISFLFAGLGLGQLVYGPLSDGIGRKPAVYVGIVFFVIGCLLSLFATDFETMLAGRALQGFGAAATRIVTVALVRDSLAGRAMARVMSFIMAVFILVPVLAPMAGQAILWLGDWRLIFIFFLVLAAVATTWFGIRQPETLPKPKRRPLSLSGIGGGIRNAATNRVTLGYTVATGFVFAPFLSYISASQQVFQNIYGTGEAFVFYFAAGAATVGISSVVNGRIVMRYGMRRLLRLALSGQVLASLVLIAWMTATGHQPGIVGWMIYLMVCFFGVGMLFGNMNAVAMEPMGGNAGAASAFIGFFSTAVGLPIGVAIGQAMDGTVLPLPVGFAICSSLSLIVARWADKGLPERPVGEPAT
ncbi:MAG: multidrug effflux MFS transporter [Minwuia sp.]|uniref:multidrug effflux MFS transporter n=1 Tax=Minwuia sp. TaxID=2493630 RepID=UPI003A8C7EFA